MGRVIAIAVLAIVGVRAAPADAEPTTLDQLLARTDAVAREVSRIRGLPLKHAIPNEVVDKEQLRARLIKLAGEDKTAGETAAEGLALKRWGMIPPATDYQQLLIDLLTEQIAGYYDSDTKKLTISKTAGNDPAWAEMVLAHELDHGLQDQTFNLHGFEDLPDSEGDAGAARRALVEGDGIALMIEVMVARSHARVDWANPEITAAITKAMGTPGSGGEGIDQAPLAIREAMLFPYRAGFSFVAALRRRHPWSAVDAAFARPPRSTEQILHPDRYLADERPVSITLAVPPSLQGYAIAQQTVWGELGFDLFLRAHGVDEAVASEAAAGWGGDRTAVLALPDDNRLDHAVGVARFEWDTEADAIEAAEAASRALDDAVIGGSFERTPNRTRWMSIDGRVSWFERKGPSLVIVLAAPLCAANAIAIEMWTATAIGKPARPAKAKRPAN